MPLADDIRTAVGQALCSTFQGYDRLSRWTAGLVYPDRIDDVYPRSPAGSIANNGIALFCDRPPDLRIPSLDGGQCPLGYQVFSGTDYSGFTNGQGAARDETQPGNVNQGPFTGIEEGPKSGSTRQFFYIRPGFNRFTLNAYNILATGLNPVPYVNLVPVAGNPDNCGDPPPPPPLPEADRTAPVTINNNNGTVVFAVPILNVNGDLQVGFTLEVGELELNGTVELNTGAINFNFGGQPTDPDAPVVPTPDGTPPDAPNDDPEEEKRANIIGVIVVSVPVGNYAGTEVPKKFMPDLYIPRIADVSFQIRIKNRSHWTSDLPVKSRNAYIPCPGEIDAIDVVVEPQAGWQVSATPVRGIVPSNQVVLV